MLSQEKGKAPKKKSVKGKVRRKEQKKVTVRSMSNCAKKLGQALNLVSLDKLTPTVIPQRML